MTTAADNPPPSTLRPLVFAYVPFALGMSFAILGAVIAPDVTHARTQYSIWVALLLAAGALFLFARDFGRCALGPLWRLYWSLALATYLFHLWYGYVVMFRADDAAVLASQGATTAIGNLIVTLLWLIDVGAAILDVKGKVFSILRIVTHAGVLAAGVVSTVVFFRNNVALAVGIALIAATAAGLLQRLRSPDWCVFQL